METDFRSIDGISIRYAQADGPADRSILLTSPWPESVYAFAPIWPSLAGWARLYAVDLPGFGRSERRDDLLAPRAMGEFIVRLIEEADLGRPHVVAPDVGTSAALFAAAARPELISSVIAGAGALAVPFALGEPLRSWVLDPDFEKFRAMDPRAVVAAAMDTIEGEGPADDARADYLDSYAGERFAESMRYVRSYPDELPQLAELMPGIETPVLIIAGERDMVVPLANAEFLDERLPHSRLAVIDGGHFVWEEAPTQYAALLTEWIGGSSEHVVVAYAANQSEAEFIQGLLRNSDVPSFVRRSAGADVPDFLAAGGRDVLVPAGAERVAREVLGS